MVFVCIGSGKALCQRNVLLDVCSLQPSKCIYAYVWYHWWAIINALLFGYTGECFSFFFVLWRPADGMFLFPPVSTCNETFRDVHMCNVSRLPLCGFNDVEWPNELRIAVHCIHVDGSGLLTPIYTLFRDLCVHFTTVPFLVCLYLYYIFISFISAWKKKKNLYTFCKVFSSAGPYNIYYWSSTVFK